MNQILPKNESLLYPIAKAYKTSLLDAGSVSKTTFWDKIIFGKVREGIVGGRLRCIVCSAEEGGKSAFLPNSLLLKAQVSIRIM
jgi:long-subunit acyl-CoA synthetase (AMP-forming)